MTHSQHDYLLLWRAVEAPKQHRWQKSTPVTGQPYGQQVHSGHQILPVLKQPKGDDRLLGAERRDGSGLPATILVCRAGRAHPGRASPGRRSSTMLPQDDFGADGGALTMTMPLQGCGVPRRPWCVAPGPHPGRPSPGPRSSTVTASPSRSVRPPADTVTAGENRTVTVLGSRILTGALVWPGSPGTIHTHLVSWSPARVPNRRRPTGMEGS